MSLIENLRSVAKAKQRLELAGEIEEYSKIEKRLEATGAEFYGTRLAEHKSFKSNLFNTPAIIPSIPAIVPSIPAIVPNIPAIDPDISKMFEKDEGKKALILVSAWEADKDPSKMAALLEKLEYGLADAVFSGVPLSVIETTETIVKNVRAIQEILFKPKVSDPSTAPEL